MSMPPETIDNAEVLYWAWSGDMPFGVVNYPDGSVAFKIFGLALCKYRESPTIYRFSCDQEWEAVQDSNYASLAEAMEELPEQYQNVSAKWCKYE
mgnify:CR=1 FL=1